MGKSSDSKATTSGNPWVAVIYLLIGPGVFSVLIIALLTMPYRPVAYIASVLGGFVVPVGLTLFLIELFPHWQVKRTDLCLAFSSGATLGVMIALPLYVAIPVVGVSLGAALAVPVVIGASEELGKLLSISWLINGQKFTLDQQGLLLGLVAGLGFSATESVGYAVRAYQEGGVQRLVHTMILRSFLTSFAHAVMTGSLTAVVLRERRVSFQFTRPVLNTYLLVTVLHALWDYQAMLGVRKGEGLAFLIISAICLTALIIIRFQYALVSAHGAVDVTKAT